MAVKIKTRTEAYAMIAGGCDPEDVRKELGIASSDMHELMKTQEFEEAREAQLAILRTQTQAILTQRLPEIIERAVDSLRVGVVEDPKLALAFLKETGALRTMGKRADFDTDAAAQQNAAGQVVINLNTEFPSKVIEAETETEDAD